MEKWYATITNCISGKQITIGENSEKHLRKTISAMEKMGMIDETWCVEIKVVNI